MLKMAKFQAVSVKPMAGIGKQSNRPYNMLIVSGILTNDDGTVELGEVTFMEGAGRPLPVVVPGRSYQPVIAGRTRQGKIQFEIVELRAEAAASSPVKVAA
jgi:hypothetical protein